jgi:hypothetical protein
MARLYLWNGQRSAAENYDRFRPLRAAPGAARGRLIHGLSAYVSDPRSSLLLAHILVTRYDRSIYLMGAVLTRECHVPF